MAGRANRAPSVLRASVVLLAATGPAAALGASEKQEQTPIQAVADGSPAQALIDRETEKLAARDRWLESPEALEEREQSRTSYDSLSDKQAEELLVEEFGDSGALEAEFPVEGEAVESYLSDYVAVLRDAGDPAAPKGPSPADRAQTPRKGSLARVCRRRTHCRRATPSRVTAPAASSSPACRFAP